MKQNYTLAVIIAGFLFSLLSTHLAAAQTNDFQQHKDSLLKVVARSEGQEKLDAYQKLTTYLFYNDSIPGNIIKAFSEFEKEALKQGNKERAGGNRGNIMTVRNIYQMYDELFKNADDDLKFITAQKTWNFYFKAYYMLVEAYFRAGQKEKSLEEAMKFYGQSKNINTPEAKAWALYTIGHVYLYSARYADGEQYLKKALQEIESSEEHYSLRYDIYYDLHQAYNNLGKTKEWALLLGKWENELKNLDATGKSQTGDWLNLYKAYTLYYLHTEDYGKMEHYCVLLEKWTASVPNIINNIFYVRQEAAKRQGNYAEVLNLAEKRFDNCVKTSNLFGQFSAMQDKTYALIHLQRTEESITAFDRTLELRDSVRNVEIQSQLDELRTQYEVDRHVAEKQRNRNYFLFALGGCLLLAVALGIYIYYNRKLAWKNRELIRKAQQWANVEPSLMIADTDELHGEGELPKAAEPDETDKLLFAEIEQLIDNGLYRESNLSLDMLAGKTGRNPTYISKAVSHCTGKTFKTWLNEYRIKEAVRLLSDKNNPNISIDTLAFDAGFNDRTTFYRVFKKTTGISPTDFKKNELRK